MRMAGSATVDLARAAHEGIDQRIPRRLEHRPEQEAERAARELEGDAELDAAAADLAGRVADRAELPVAVEGPERAVEERHADRLTGHEAVARREREAKARAGDVDARGQRVLLRREHARRGAERHEGRVAGDV